MALDLDRINRKREDLKRKAGNYWRPQEGKNTIRVFTFQHKVTQGDIDAALFPRNELGKFVEDIDRPVMQQFGIRSDKRPIIATEDTLKRYRAAKKEDAELARQIRPARRFLLNVVDTAHPEEGVKVYAAPKMVIEAVYDVIRDPEKGPEILGIKGRDFVIVFKPKNEAATMYSVQLRDEKFCKPLGSDVLKKVKDLYDPAVISDMYAEAEEAVEAPAEEEPEAVEPTEETTESTEEVVEDTEKVEETAEEGQEELFDEPEEKPKAKPAPKPPLKKAPAKPAPKKKR